MNDTSIYYKDYDGARAELFVYRPEGGTAEAHVMLHATDCTMTFDAQVMAIRQAATDLQRTDLLGLHPVFKRYFLSDSANQYTALTQHSDSGEGTSSHGVTSIIEQPPLDGTKVALWMYLLGDSNSCYKHTWTSSSMAEPEEHADTSFEQTKCLLTHYADSLRNQGCTLERNCVRTWFFVQNVDVNYGGLVKARNEVFAYEGLSSTTHFIASTGIGGRHHDHHTFVTMDTYAIDGLLPGQMKYLYARTHLNPTYEYGVSFERGTTVDYGDRRHVFVSGTASINNKGQVVYQGDIKKQTERMWDNVEALLTEADCTWEHVSHMIVYLRDVSDYAVVKGMFDARFPHTPRVITYARVCRPGWLIEMECMAVHPAHNPQLAPL